MTAYQGLHVAIGAIVGAVLILLWVLRVRRAE